MSMTPEDRLRKIRRMASSPFPISHSWEEYHSVREKRLAEILKIATLPPFRTREKRYKAWVAVIDGRITATDINTLRFHIYGDPYQANEYAKKHKCSVSVCTVLIPKRKGKK